MVAEPHWPRRLIVSSCSLAKISMVAEPWMKQTYMRWRCSLAKISMVAELASIL